MKMRRIDHPEQGAAAVEFALIMPLLSVLLFGIIEFSILFYNKAMITNASREGARAGIVYNFPDRPSDADIASVVAAYCGSHLITFGDPTQVPSTTVARVGAGTGSDLSVTVDYEYDFLLLPNLLGAFFTSSQIGNKITLEAKTVMRLE